MGIVMAKVRNEHTRYDELWRDLEGYCQEFTDTYRRNMDVCIAQELEPGDECPHKEEAYLILKEAANRAAYNAILAWRRRHS
jgi:hypothetical protein